MSSAGQHVRIIAHTALCLLCVGLSSCRSSPSHRDDARATQFTFEHARQLYITARQGDADAHSRARAAFETLHERNAENPLIATYLGSILLIDAGRVRSFIEKATLARRGLALLEQAATEAPNSTEATLIRGITFHHLPATFDRQDEAIRLIAQVTQSDELSNMPAPLQATAWQIRGVHLAQVGDDSEATKAWQRTIQLAPNSTAANEARRQLKHHRPTPP